MAGREVAWAVWEYVKDLDPGEALGGGRSGWDADEVAVGQKRAFDGAWDDEHISKKARMDEDVEKDGEDEKPLAQHTLGVMLRRLGIDPATLGWDEEEGDFVDI